MRRIMRSIALLGLVVVRTATATRVLRGLAEHSPANVTAANYTRCVFQRVSKVECHSTYSQKLRFKDEAFSQCDADPKCDAVQKHWKEKNYDANYDKKKVEYKLCSLRKDACDRVRLDEYRSDCDENDTWCTYNHVFTCLPYDEAPAMRSGGLFALCIIMIFACPLLICIGTAASASEDQEDPGVFMICPIFCCPCVVVSILIFAFLSAYYGPAHNHSTNGACDPRVEPAIVVCGVITAAIVVCGVITTGISCGAALCGGGAKESVSKAPPEPEMDLWRACCEGAVAAVRRLLKKGAAINRANEGGETPLLIACSNGHVAAARLLLDNGAEVDRAKENGETPLCVAKRKGHAAVVALLEEVRET